MTIRLHHKVLSFTVALSLLLLVGCGPKQLPTESLANSETVSQVTSEAESEEVSSAEESQPEESEEPESSEESSAAPEEGDGAQLIVDFSASAQDKVEKYPYSYTGELTPSDLALGLSELTGLNFHITAEVTDEGITVDWLPDSTLLEGLGDRTQKEEFYAVDNNVLRWFMMDSLYRTLQENMDAENIYYTCDGGKELYLEDLVPVDTIALGASYQGSRAYEQ